MVLLHVVSDSVIALAYYSIPMMLVYFVQKRRDVPFNGVFLLFGAFIIACGTGHLMDVWTLLHPVYWLSGLLKAITAVISFYTALVLLPLIPQALALPSPAQLEAANQALEKEICDRKQAEADVRRLNAELEQRVNERTAQLRLVNEKLAAEIAERIQASEALRQAEEKYRSIFENASGGIFQTTPDGRYLSANPALARIYGYSSSEELIAKLTDLNRQIYVDLNWRAEFMRLMHKYGAVYNFESQAYRQDRSLIWVSENARAVRDANGVLLYYEGSVEDITERKLAEAKLQASEQKLRQVIDLVPHFIFAKNIDGQFILVNQALADAYGSSVEQMLNKKDADFAQSLEEVRQFQEVDLQVIHSRQPKHIPEETITDAQGNVRILQTTKIPFSIAGSDTPAVLGIAIDITERKQVEQELRESEAAIRALYEVTASGQRDFDQSLQKLLAMGRQQFGMDIGVLSYVEGDRYQVIATQLPNNINAKGAILDLRQTYCHEALQAKQPFGILSAGASQWRDHPAYEAFKLEAYIGAPVVVAGNVYGTLSFSSYTPRQKPFKALDKELLRLMAQWMGGEIDRQQAAHELAKARDREMCLAAGMDDYVSKPIRVEELVRALSKCQEAVGNGNEMGTGEEVSTKAHPLPTTSSHSPSLKSPTPPVLDAQVFRQLREMVNKDEILVEVVDHYLEEAPQLLRSLTEAVAKGEAVVLQRVAHTLKSTSAMLGATSLSQLCQKLEALSESICSANAPTVSLASSVALVSQLETEYEKVQIALRQSLQQLISA